MGSMIRTNFTFNQSGGHSFHCPSSYEQYANKTPFTIYLTDCRANLPFSLETLLRNPRLRCIHHVSLGHADSFFVTWRDSSGKDHVDSQNLPKELDQFVYARTSDQKPARDISRLRCSMGPYNTSFYAEDGTSYLWKNLPAGLLSAFQVRLCDSQWIDRPRILSLGANNNFVLVTENHAAVWRLDNYRSANDLLRILQKQWRGAAELCNVSLHPYRYESFVAQSQDGNLLYENLPEPALCSMQRTVAALLSDYQRLESLKITEQQERDARVPKNTRDSPRRRNAQERSRSDHSRQVTARSGGLKVNLSLSIKASALTRLLG